MGVCVIHLPSVSVMALLLLLLLLCVCVCVFLTLGATKKMKNKETDKKSQRKRQMELQSTKRQQIEAKIISYCHFFHAPFLRRAIASAAGASRFTCAL